jgi:hypothetical protein
VGASVCGADGCREIPHAGPGILEGGPQVDAPARAEPFVRLTIEVGAPDRVQPLRLLFLPSSELVLGDDGATWMAPMALGEMRAIARRVKPFPARQLPASVALGTAKPVGSGEPPAPEVLGPAARSSPAAATSDDGFGGWWLAAPGVVILLAAAAVPGRRRRRDPAARAAGATG